MKEKAASFLSFLKVIYSQFQEKDILTLTASVAFYAFLSLFPFLVMVIATSALFIDEAKVMAKVEEQLRLFPEAVSGFANANIQALRESSQVLSLFSFLFLVYLAVKVFVQLEKALYKIFGRRKKVKALKVQGRAFLFFAGASFLLLIFFLSGNTLLVIATKFEKLPLIKAYYAVIVGYILVEALFFAASYKYFAPKELTFSTAFKGGLTAAFFWEILKNAFGLYIVRVKMYHLIYGTIGSIVLLLLWLYYSILVYFLGAMLSAQLASRKTSRKK
ncbi:MAG: YihY/virulence factor BrkB family protein [Acidobacteriota bacterium]